MEMVMISISTLPTRAARMNAYSNGEVVFVMSRIYAGHMNAWVQRLEEESSQEISWHEDGVRMVVKALGDIDRVKATIRRCIQDFDVRYRYYAYSRAGIPMDKVINLPRPSWWA